MIEFKKVNKAFDLANKEKLEVLKDFDLSVKKNEIVLLKGASGCGKSTILSLCAAMQKPNSGKIIVNGESLGELSDRFASMFRLKHIGFIFQKHHLLKAQNTLQNLSIPLLTSTKSLKEIEYIADNLLETFDLKALKYEMIENLSGGEQQRIAIARALMNNPSIILADEPTSNLDKNLSEIFIDTVHLLKEKNKTILIATHDDIFTNKCKYDQEINLDKLRR